MVHGIKNYSKTYFVIGDFMKYRKYGEAFLLSSILLFFFSMIVTLFGHFNLISSKMMQPILLFITMFSFFAGGLYLGVKCEKRGWLEGLKLGSFLAFLFFLISYLGFDQGMHLKTFLYYLLLLSSSILGSMLGISKQTEK